MGRPSCVTESYSVKLHNMDRTIQPARNVLGGLRLPGDKSISHRYALLGAIAEGETTIRNYAPGADCASTLQCLEKLGVRLCRRRVESQTGQPAEEVVIAGRRLGGQYRVQVHFTETCLTVRNHFQRHPL